MAVTFSALESDRFGFRIGRGEIGSSLDAMAFRAEIEGFDIVIVRAPAQAREVGAGLAMVDGYRAFTADHLLYWEWRGSFDTEPVAPPGLQVVTTTDADLVGSLVDASFADYRNHYVANPLLEPRKALDGYIEWARVLMESGDVTAKVLHDADGDALGFGIIDWSSAVPDIRLAAMRPASQGGGLYGHVLRSLTYEAHLRGTSLRISTQSDNVKVMRVWTRHGFEPVFTLATHHLVEAGLLARGAP